MLIHHETQTILTMQIVSWDRRKTILYIRPSIGLNTLKFRLQFCICHCFTDHCFYWNGWPVLPSFWICSRYSKISQKKILPSDSQVLFPNFPSPAMLLQAWAACQQNFSLLVSQAHCAARAAAVKSAWGKVFGADVTTACGKAASQTRCCPQPSAT